MGIGKVRVTAVQWHVAVRVVEVEVLDDGVEDIVRMI